MFVIDIDKIINDTSLVFENASKKLSTLPSISKEDYYRLHTKPLTPLNIKIDCKQFLNEIKTYDKNFKQWGTEFQELPRYGIALVNQDGLLKDNDPINGSLYEWNKNNRNKPLIETDCRAPTKVFNLESLNPLRIFDQHWCRSNILKWETNAKFMPHVDCILPTPWIRLWGTTDAENTVINFYDKKGPIDIEPIESGRIYIIDTSLVHDASANGSIYQFFLSVLPSAYNLLLSASKEGT